jgi:hypothetical protein
MNTPRRTLRPFMPASHSSLIPPIALTALIALAACSRSSDPSQAAPAGPTAPVASATPGKTGAAIVRGRVLFRGPVPESREPAAPFPECSKRVAQAPLQVTADGAVANVFVYVKDGLPPGGYPVPAEPVTLDQHDCEYFPHVFGIRPGQPLRIRNLDDLLHNVNARGQGAGLSRGPNAFNVAMPLKGMTLTRKFDEPQVAVTITCDVHPWMRSYAGVVAHPFFAVTKDDGAFTLPGLPAGHYSLEAWHERLGRTSVQVDLSEAAPTEATLEFKP